MNSQESKKESHPHFRKDKGVTIDFGGHCVFLKPGQTYQDMRGRRYKVAEDGSLRRIKE